MTGAVLCPALPASDLQAVRGFAPEVEAWAGLMSYVVLETYGPHSAMRHAGWYADVPRRLRRTCGRLSGPLRWVAGKTGALGFSVGVSFPGGVSVSLSWTP